MDPKNALNKCLVHGKNIKHGLRQSWPTLMRKCSVFSLVSVLLFLCFISTIQPVSGIAYNNLISDFGFESGAIGTSNSYGNWTDATGTYLGSGPYEGSWCAWTTTAPFTWFMYNFTIPIIGSNVLNFSTYVDPTAGNIYEGRITIYYDDSTNDIYDFVLGTPNWKYIDLISAIDTAKTMVAFTFEGNSVLGGTTIRWDNMEMFGYVPPEEPSYIHAIIGFAGVAMIMLGVLIPSYMISKKGFFGENIIIYIGYGALSILIGYGLMRVWLFGGFG